MSPLSPLNKDLIDDEPYLITDEQPEEETKGDLAKKKKKHNRNKYGRLFINVNYCHYPGVRTVAKMNKIKITYSDEEDWDVYWSDGAQ